MQSIPCKTCALNSMVYPFVLCPTEPFGESFEESPVKKCKKYISKNTPWIAICFTYPDKTKRIFNDVITYPVLHGIKLNGIRPTKVTLSAGGLITSEHIQTFKKITLKQIKQALNPAYKDNMYFIGNTVILKSIA